MPDALNEEAGLAGPWACDDELRSFGVLEGGLPLVGCDPAVSDHGMSGRRRQMVDRGEVARGEAAARAVTDQLGARVGADEQ